MLGKLNGVELNRCAGGSAANTIMGISDFGGQAAYVGKVGQDEIEEALGDMRKMGVTRAQAGGRSDRDLRGPDY